MNAGSVQAAPPIKVSQPGKTAVASGKDSGGFGSVLAGLKQPQQAAAAVPTDKPAATGAGRAGEILSSTDIDALAAELEEITGMPAEELVGNLGSLKADSSLSDWAEALGMDAQEVIDALGPLLEDAGLTKEQLAEVSYSNDLWPLVQAVAAHASELAEKLGNSLGNNTAVSGQTVELLAFLKTVATAVPAKDMMGWQEEQLKGLGALLEAVKGHPSLQNVSQQEQTSGKTAFSMLFRSPAAVQPQQENVQNVTQHTILQAVAAAAQNGDKASNSEGENEQNQVQLVQNGAAQPIVSKNVFSLETPQARPSGQAEALLAKLQNLFAQTNFGQTGGTNRLLVKLYPEHLGQVRIELLQVNGVMTARILASTALGKEMLDSQLHQLRQSFSQQNIQVDRIDVTQAVHDPSRNERNQQFGQQQFKGNEDQPEQREAEQEEQQTFQEFLVDLEV